MAILNKGAYFKDDLVLAHFRKTFMDPSQEGPFNSVTLSNLTSQSFVQEALNMYCDIAEGMQRNARQSISLLLESHGINLSVFKTYCSMLSTTKSTFAIEDIELDEYRFIALLEKAFSRLCSFLLEN